LAVVLRTAPLLLTTHCATGLSIVYCPLIHCPLPTDPLPTASLPTAY